MTIHGQWITFFVLGQSLAGFDRLDRIGAVVSEWSLTICGLSATGDGEEAS